MSWPPPRHPLELAVAIPTNFTSEAPSLREKTEKLGFLSRALAIFRVSRLVLFRRHPDEERLIRLIIEYHRMPPYLKRYIPLRPELRYAGLLPPLRTPSHATPREVDAAVSYQYREGYVIDRVEGGYLVDVGMDKPALARGGRLRRGEVRLFRVVGIDDSSRLLVEPADRASLRIFWCYELGQTYGGLRELLRAHRGWLRLATSRWGTPLHEVAGEVLERMLRTRRVLLVFGAPKEGLYDIAADEGFELESEVDFVLNTIPDQGVLTVRTEEAVLASLACLELLLRLGRKYFKTPSEG